MAWTAPRDWTAISGGIVTAASLNTDLRDNLGILSTHTHTGAAGFGASSMTGLTLAALVTLTFADQSANPDAAGELQRNGNDILWYGSSVVNLTASDASAGTASLRSLGTTSVKAAAGNHGHTMAGLTGVEDLENDTLSTGGSDDAGSLLDQIATSATEVATLTPSPSEAAILFAGATYILQGHASAANYSCVLVIDGTTVDTQSGTAGAGTAVVVRGQGLKQVTSGSKTVTATITNTDGSDVLRGIVAVHVVAATVS